MIFTEAIKEAQLINLKKNKKFLIIGLGMNYPSEGLYSKFPKRVFDTPVSESALTGTAVGLASQGFNPLVVHGRVEFAMLAFDQIFTQASRWEYMFGGNYPCPLSLRIAIGRQWGNGPQHTANYNSIFMQAPGLNVIIPSTPEEIFFGIRFLEQSKSPTAILEHRWLYKTSQKFKKISTKVNSFPLAKLYSNKKSSILVITYGDGLIDSLKSQQILKEKKINIDVLNLCGFKKNQRISNKIIKKINFYKHIVYFDTSPFDFGILSGIASHISKKKYVISPEFKPCPTSPHLTKNYYKTYKDIVKRILKLKNKSKFRIKNLTFEEENLWPNFDFSIFKPRNIFYD